MARPVNRRSIEKPPIMEGFKPFGIPMRELEPVILLFEEYEAMRLADYLGLSHQDAARQMNVSRPTFTRVYEKARRTLSTALVEGKALLIEGGNYQTNDCWNRCEQCSKLFVCPDEKAMCPFCHKSTGRRLHPNEATSGTNGFCICTQCHTKVAHVRGQPCRESQCPSCGARMIRENCPSTKTKNES
jgi:predicted DNA-binding protein (UPF0251 family)